MTGLLRALVGALAARRIVERKGAVCDIIWVARQRGWKSVVVTELCLDLA